MAKTVQSEELVILSVRNKRTSIEIVYRKGTDDYSVNFHENPLPSFAKSIEALGPHVATLCELPASEAKKIVATGITVREDGDNMLGLIVAKKSIKKGKRVMNIATPLLSMYPDDENKTLDHMDEGEARAIEKVIKEATRYLAGERAQGLITFEEEPKKKKEDDSTVPLKLEPADVPDGDQN